MHERSNPVLGHIPKATFVEAVELVEELVTTVRATRDPNDIATLDALIELLRVWQSFREEKVWAIRDAAPSTGATSAEQQYLTAIRAATAEYRAAWGIP